MKIHRLLLMIAVLSLSYVKAQTGNSLLPPVLYKAGDASCTGLISTPCLGLVNTPSADLTWKPGLSYLIGESEPMEPNHDLIEKERNEITARKLIHQQENTRQYTNPGVNQIQAVVPVVGINYTANKYNGWVPMDNNMAISNNGIIVTVANATIEVDDSTGHNLYYNTLNTFINDNAIPNVCDPIVYYDSQADRFIFYCQENTTTAYAPNHMLFFFSKTNNPATGGWYYYKLSGNPLNDGSWADYPKMGISDHDLFLSSNLFNSSGAFNQTIVCQIEKIGAYSGGTLNSKLWSGFAGSPFTLLPVSEGHGQSYGPGCWIASTSASGSSNINLYKITDDLSGTPTVNHYSVSTTAYALSGNTLQKGTSATLKIADCRSFSGFYLNGIIHFVFNSADASGNTGINYNRLDVSTKTNTSKLFSANNTDYGYPAVASYAVTSNDKSVMIGFSQGNANIYPEIDVVNCDDGMNFSTITTVKTSDSYVGSSSGVQRWGDYSGMCRKQNSLQPCVWMAGAYGTISNNWGAYVAQIYDAGYATSITDSKPRSSVKLYPNPVVDMINLEFASEQSENLQIAVYNLQGQLVKQLYNGPCHGGECLFSFNKSPLAAGIYQLMIRNGNELIKNEKIVLAN
jgi:hypothetical protein